MQTADILCSIQKWYLVQSTDKMFQIKLLAQINPDYSF